MVKKTKTKDESLSLQKILKGALLSVKDHPFAYILLLLGAALIIWPRFFIQDIREYPECIVYDFFPISNGYPSDNLKSFMYFVQLPLAIVGSLLIAYGVAVIRKKVKVGYIAAITASIVIVAIMLHTLALVAGFDMQSADCSKYQEIFPDFNLIIDSRR